MSSIIPNEYSGGLPVRDVDGNTVTQPDVSNYYIPSKEFNITCNFNYLPSNCSARIMPEQINAFQSEMIAFAESLAPNGKWDCGVLNNLAVLFQKWANDTIPDLSNYVDKNTLDEYLSVVPFVPVESMTLTTPPDTPTKGKLYLVPFNATDAWANNNGQISEWNGNKWIFAKTNESHTISLPDGRFFTKLNGAYIEKLALDTQSGKWLYAEASGSANALTATLTPAPTALPKQIIILPKYDNTDAATLILNGFSQRSILSQNGSTLVAGDLKAGTPALLALMANGNYTLTNAASAPPPGTGFAGSKTFFSWKPNTAATSNLEASFIAPCVGIIMAFSTANKSYYASDGNVKNSVSVNNSTGNTDWVSASSVSTSILLVAKGTACTVKSSVSVDKGLVAPVSQYLNYVFIPA